MERIALDLENYNPSTLDNIIEDTASLAIEAANDPNTPRVNVHYYVKRGEDWAISPGRDKRDVLQKFSNETEIDKQTSIAGEKIRGTLLDEPVGTVFVWISPMQPYPETRIVVGVKKQTISKKYQYLECYGISTTLSRQDSLLLMQFLVSLSDRKHNYPDDPEELRSLVVNLNVPDDTDPFKYLSELIKLPETDRFESILNGKAKKIKSQAVKAAAIATSKARNNPQIIYIDPIGQGSYIESYMGMLGFGMNPKGSGCGISNTDALNIYSSTATEFNPYSNQYSMVDAGDGLGPAEFPCPECHHINRRPLGGYVYSCQNPRCPNPSAVVCGN